eukprot:364173-Chlamydomonas_euryale.AAC.3
MCDLGHIARVPDNMCTKIALLTTRHTHLATAPADHVGSQCLARTSSAYIYTVITRGTVMRITGMPGMPLQTALIFDPQSCAHHVETVMTKAAFKTHACPAQSGKSKIFPNIFRLSGGQIFIHLSGVSKIFKL